jgi:putative aldouronate transport system permease protein
MVGIKQAKKKRYTFFTDVSKNPASYLLVLPALVYTLIFGYATLPYTVIAFQKFSFDSGLLSNKWIGFKNFEFFFRSTSAATVTWNTLKLNFLFIVLGTVVAVFYSLLMNEVRGKWFLKITQSSFLFPNFLSWVIVGYIVYNIFSTDYGVLNQFLKFIGQEPRGWYSNPDVWPGILVLMRIWKDTGIKTVIFLAAISSIDEQLYEAATIDGANRLQKIKAITIPLILPTVIILTLLAIGKIFYGDFAMMYSIIRDNGVLLPSTDVIDTFVFRALRLYGDPSQAMAVGLYQAFMGFILVYGSNRLTKKYFSEGALF